MKFYRDYIKKTLSLIGSSKDKNKFLLDELLRHNVQEILGINNIHNQKEISTLEELLKDLMGTSLVEGLCIIRSLKNTENIEGDICEFGVAQGKTSKLIGYLIKNLSKKLYLIDSFQGLPTPTKEDELKDDIFNLGNMQNYTGKMSHSENKVLNELNSINFDKKRLIINKGFFNKSSDESMNLPTKVSFAYLDFDFYQPTIDGLNYLKNVLSSGGIIIVDDYDFFSTGAKKSVDEWFNLNSKNYSLEIVKTKSASFAIIRKNK